MIWDVKHGYALYLKQEGRMLTQNPLSRRIAFLLDLPAVEKERDSRTEANRQMEW